MDDLVIRNGRVIDPGNAVDGICDVLIENGRIAALEPGTRRVGAREIDAAGLLVLPGLVDLHVHVYEGVAAIGIDADRFCLPDGATTVLDAGSAGAQTFPAFRRFIVEPASTRIYVLLNISTMGQLYNNVGELEDLRFADVEQALQTIERNRDVILGVKVRLSKDQAATNDYEALARARAVAEAAQLPFMAHIGDTFTPLEVLLREFRSGDIVTHSFHGRPQGILDEDDRVWPWVQQAAARGVQFDVGHGAGSFSFRVAERALAQDFVPATISSDLHGLNVFGPVHSLTMTVSKFMHLGMSLTDAIRRVTSNPARLMGAPEGIGSLSVGGPADVVVATLEERSIEFRDAGGEVRLGERLLRPLGVVRAGDLAYASPELVVRRSA